MSQALWGGILAGYGIAIPVGAIALLIVGTGMRCGFTCAASAGAGAATADLFYAATAAAAGTAASRLILPWQGAFRLVGATVLALLALWGLAAMRRPVAANSVGGSDGHLVTYARFLGLTVVNPLTVVYFTSMVVGSSAVAAGGPGHAISFAVGAFGASLSWQTLLAALGAFGGRSLSRRIRVGLTVAGNLLILVLAVRMILIH